MSSSHKVCFSLLFKSIIKTLEIISNIRKSVVVNGDKDYTVYTFSSSTAVFDIVSTCLFSSIQAKIRMLIQAFYPIVIGRKKMPGYGENTFI